MVETISKVFFHLQPGKHRELLSKVEELAGHFQRMTKNRYVFVVDTDDDNLSLKMMCITSNERFKLLPQMFTEISKPITLKIAPDKDLFSVTGFSVDNSDMGLGLTNEYFNHLVACVDHGTPLDEGHFSGPYRFKSISEVNGFFKATEQFQPKWVRDAFKANCAIAKSSHSDTIKGHANCVNKFLMTVDWTERPLYLPSLESARAYLDEHLYGMDSVKEELLSVLAALRRGCIPKPILLDGPPGVGKTVICNLLGDLFGLHVIYLDLSTRDRERAGISGSERHFENGTYGSVAQGFERARSSTAIMVLNELDKVFVDSNGKKSSSSIGDTLLSIIDGTGMEESYLEVKLPTDRLVVVATCNDSEKLSPPLLNRFQVIKIAPYSFDEKLHILREHTVPKELASNKLPDSTVLLDEEAEKFLIQQYCVDAGARKLEQFTAKLVRDHVRAIEEGRAEEGNGNEPVYSSDTIRAALGPPPTINNQFAVYSGEANGVFVHDGSPHMFLVEASVRPGKGECEALGFDDVIQEQFLKAAYYAVRDSLPVDFSKLDVTFMSPLPVPKARKNYIGLAAFAALFSKLSDVEFEMQNTCFLGAVDLHGNVYSCYDAVDLAACITELSAKGVTTVYAPMGTAAMLDSTAVNGIQIIESVDAKSIFDIASAISRAS